MCVSATAGVEHGRDGGQHASTSGRDEPQLLKANSSRLSLGRLFHRPSLDSQLLSEAIVSLIPSGTEILFALGLDHRSEPLCKLSKNPPKCLEQSHQTVGVPRVIGVTDLCDFPGEARSRPKVSRTSIDTSGMSMEEVEVQMQRCKAEGRPPFQVDGEFLARHQPGLLVTQDTCQTCDPSTSAVLQVAPGPPLLDQSLLTSVCCAKLGEPLASSKPQRLVPCKPRWSAFHHPGVIGLRERVFVGCCADLGSGGPAWGGGTDADTGAQPTHDV